MILNSLTDPKRSILKSYFIPKLDFALKLPNIPQVVIFVKSVQRCVALAQLLTEQNFPAIGIHRGMNQEERLSRYQQFKDFQKVKSDLLFLSCTNINKNCFRRGFLLRRIYSAEAWISRELISSSIMICRKIQTLIFTGWLVPEDSVLKVWPSLSSPKRAMLKS